MNRHHHGRGSLARHTLGVDVSWLKKLVTNKHGNQNGEEEQSTHQSRIEEEELAGELDENGGSRRRKPSETAENNSSGSGGGKLNEIRKLEIFKFRISKWKLFASFQQKTPKFAINAWQCAGIEFIGIE